MRFARRALLVVAALALLAAPAQARERFDVRVLAHEPPPGYSALTLVAPDGTIYAGTFYGASGGDNGPSKVFAFSPTGVLLRTYTIEGQTPGAAHGIQVAAIDARGVLYLLDQAPARVLTLDPRSGRQASFATFADVPTCSAAPAKPDCSATVTDNPPEPDYAAWGPDGSLYVTDYQQGLIWRVPAGGGTAHVWFTDPQIDGAVFGPAGIVLLPDHRTLMFSTSAGGVATPGNPTTGKLYTIPIGTDGKPGELHKLYESGPREAPDGFALAASGNIYLALVGPGTNQVVELAPDGHELGRVPANPLANAQLQVPFDEPSSVQFSGQDLIVTNDPYVSGDQSHMVLFDIFAGELGQPVFIPPASVSGSGGRRPVSPGRGPARIALSASPRVISAGRPQRVRFHARLRAGGSSHPVRGALITFAHRRLRTDRRGDATLVVTLRRPGRYAAVLRRSGGTVLATTEVRAVGAARFTG